MSLIGAPSFAAGKVFDLMLKEIFPRSAYHIKDSFEFRDFINGVNLDVDDVLVSFDVVSMFTSIPRVLVKDLVMRKQRAFLRVFGMGARVLEKFLDFLLFDSTVFTALGQTYKQNEGLPMGSCISPTLARITMDEVVKHLLLKIPKIPFIRIFVDDTITAINKDSVPLVLSVLNDFHRDIKFTYEMEDANQSINFLNLTLIRRDCSIITNWYRKGFASGRLLNYLSSHKRTTVMETGINFVIMVRKLSDESFFQSNRVRVESTLRENSFPETVIISLMSEHYSLMKLRALPKKPSGSFSVFPHAICDAKRIKGILHKYKEKDIIYAESTRNCKINHVRTKKTYIPKRLRGNMIVTSNCVCKKKHKVVATGFDQTAEALIGTLKTKFVRCTKTLHAFRKFKILRGLAYGSQTSTLAKYIQWQFRNSYLNTRTGRPEFHFANLLKATKC